MHYQVVDQTIPLWLRFLSRPLIQLDQGVWVEVNNPKKIFFSKFRQSMASQTKKESQNLHD